MGNYYSTRGLTIEQRRVFTRLPTSVQADWVRLCQQFEVVRCPADSITPRGGWAITGHVAPAGTFAESPLELIEVMRGWMR